MVLTCETKPIYKSDEGKAFWDVAVYAEHTYVRAHRVDVRFVDHKAKQVWTVEMSCPWIDKRAKKVEEKAIKYGPLLLELKQQHPGYEVQQCNIIIDSMGGWLKDVEETMKVRFREGAESHHFILAAYSSLFQNNYKLGYSTFY